MSRFLAAGSLQNVRLSLQAHLIASKRPISPKVAHRAYAQRAALLEYGKAPVAASQRRVLSTGPSEPSSTSGSEHTAQPKASDSDSDPTRNPDIERIVHEARQRFRDTLPPNYLNEEEFSLYVRLYGHPLRETTPEDVGIPFSGVESLTVLPNRPDPTAPALLKETAGGGLEEVRYTRDIDPDDEVNLDADALADTAGAVLIEAEAMLSDDQREYISAVARNQREYDALIKLQHDFEVSSLKALEEAEELEGKEDVEELAAQSTEDEILRQEMDEAELEETALSSVAALRQLQAASRGVEQDETASERSPSDERTHPYTQRGRFSTNPKTLLLPQSTFNEPIAQLLDRTSIKHIRMAAEAALGGAGLPDSPSTAGSKRANPQRAVGLEAAQHKMSPIEADAFISTVLPPAYAATMSALVEVRKRLGTDWLQNLLRRDDGQGPRVLDVGAGGAGLAAWQDIAQAEWDTMQDSGNASGAQPPSGKKTVIVGSDNLRHRISRFLHNTTFLPRLPDYVHSVDMAHRNLDAPKDPLPKKTYDLIIASYCLLPLQEGHRRKAMLNKLWSLLSPKGGVLVFVEKGHPRGFEAIADVREKLIQEYLTTPADPGHEPVVTDEFDPAYHRVKEPGMIVAPCTNHRKCPMYTIPGRSKGRKDFCSFQQRFYRPRFLQRILGARGDRNHDDVRFSYVAIQRGGGEGAREKKLLVGDEATERAFAGYEDAPEAPSMFSLPRQVLPPLKRKGHIQLEVCTPSGRIERWTVPKSRGKQSYHDARKAVWGDLWALGAKTRTPRSIRLGHTDEDEGGTVSKKKRAKVVKVEADDGGIRRVIERDGEPVSRKKGSRAAARRSAKDEMLRDDD